MKCVNPACSCINCKCADCHCNTKVGQMNQVNSKPLFMDMIAKDVTNLWKSKFPDATLLPVIGLPSNNKGVMTMTHTMSQSPLMPMQPMKINGLRALSPLANNALFSSELSDGKWLNLYEIMLPDIPGTNGAPSSTQRYINAMQKLGIDVAGVHFHWTGSQMLNYFPLAIHSQNIGMHPIEFSQKQLQALQMAM